MYYLNNKIVYIIIWVLYVAPINYKIQYKNMKWYSVNHKRNLKTKNKNNTVRAGIISGYRQ